MADEEEDQTTTLDPLLAMSAADALEQQKRLEEEAVARALPLQSAEAELLGAGARTARVAPGEYAFGTVAPTSRGFMYIGRPVPGPEPGTPLATQREYETAVQRGAGPQAMEALSGLETMGLRPPGVTVGLPREVPMPMGTGAEERFAAMDRYQRARSKGYSHEESKAMSGFDLLPAQRGAITPYQQAQLNLKQQAATAPKFFHVGNRLYSVQGGAATPLTPERPEPSPGVKMTYASLLTAERQAQGKAADDPAAAAAATAARQAYLDEHPELLGRTAAPAAAPTAVPVTTPSAVPAVRAGSVSIGGTPATLAAAPPPKPKPVPPRNQLVTGEVYLTKRGPARWNGSQFVKI